jgi:hypothetical protein
VLIAKSTTALHTGSKRGIFAAMRYEVTDDHITLICHEYCSPI